MDRKGKQVAGIGSYSGGMKRKRVDDGEASGSRNKRRNPEVLQFIEDSSVVGYYGESSDEENFIDDMEDDAEPEKNDKNNPAKTSDPAFVFPKEEEIDEEEYDKMMEDRYKPGSGFGRYTDDDVKRSIEMDSLAPTSKDPLLWKIKCVTGREKHSVFCLMHKFVELRKLHTKLQIISSFFLEHVKGFIFIEAEKECDILEACKGLPGIYSTSMMLVPKNEGPRLLTIQKKTKKFTGSTWARVKNGKYKGDITQVVAVNDTQRKALIKLIPRIDLQALAQKYGGGVALEKGMVPAPRLICPSELEEFRPLIQVRRDRDTGMTFENLDGLMLKDGYLYKKVSLDSLCSWGAVPSKDEILKFMPVGRKEAGDVEWISEIYGEEKKKTVQVGRAGGKGESSSGSIPENGFGLYNLVCFSRRDFGLIVGMEKGDSYKILKEGADGPVVVTVGKKELKNGTFDTKFTALDLNKKQISISDVVKVSKGPLEGKQGVVRQVYRGVIFFHDENEEENGGYVCCKSQICEKIKLFTDVSNEKTGGCVASGFGDSVSSPRSPLSPENEFQPKENFSKSNRGDRDSGYSIGQTLRIRVGPLKGYLCRVLGIRYSDVTVKLDSQHKILTVKSEHLAEVRCKNSALTSEDAGPSSFKPFDLLGTEGNSEDWTKGAGASAEGGGWNMEGSSSEWSSWGSKPTAGDSSQQQSVLNDNNSSWARAAENDKTTDQAGGWNSWGKKDVPETDTGDGTSGGGWGKTATLDADAAGSSKVEASSWSKQEVSAFNKEDSGSGWGKRDMDSVWNKQDGSTNGGGGGGGSLWGKSDEGSSWAKHGESSNVSKRDEGSGWGTRAGGSNSSQNKEESSWVKQDGDTGWGSANDGSDKSQNDGGASGWGNSDGGSSWSKQDAYSRASQKGGGSWGQQDKGSDWSKEGSTWGKQDGGCGSGEKEDVSWGKKLGDSQSSEKEVPGWGKQDGGGSSWNKESDWKQSATDKSGLEQQNWERPQAFDSRGGRGFGGRRGGRRGGRDQFGRGRSFGRGQSYGNSSQFSANDSADPTPWSKQGGSSGWGGQDGGSSWRKQGEGSGWGKQDSGSAEGKEGGSSWGKEGGASWTKQDGGSSWGNKQDGGSAWSKQDEGSSWGKKPDGGSSWGNKLDGGSSWGNKQDDGSSWGNKQDGGSSWGNKQDGGSSWGNKQDGGSSWGNKQDAGSAWSKKDEGSSWGKKPDGGSSWGNKLDGGSSWVNKQDGGSAWGNKQDGGSAWSKQDEGSSWGKKPDGGSSWGNKQIGGSSWTKQDENAPSNKHDGGSTWGNKTDGVSTWNKNDTDSGWGKQQDAGTSWSKQDDGAASGNKLDDDGTGGSSRGKHSGWGNQDNSGKSSWNRDGENGSSSWGKQNDQGGGSSWAKQEDGGGSRQWNDQSRSWEEQRDFSDGNRGFGGRRGGGFRGGRSQWGRGGGRSFDQSGGWKRDQGGDGGPDWKKGWGEDADKGEGSGWGKKDEPSSNGWNNGSGSNGGNDQEGNAAGNSHEEAWGKASSWGKGNDKADGGNNGGW
ncbi:PREDICTED: protein RNA-directed DNA methylation 3 isoform X2 [Tarenaya hassleriana]|uniref:protein RNA-directed DNA methylation 3 isoform X2 n=1 Tax=Tarenaya hassleriana TaxID=28532 RepID=UPI00053C8E77|nr:PREDICTED: protein RNA-directed DNA methylation 3 isoform X2 [Tarenaya hassleriana]